MGLTAAGFFKGGEKVEVLNASPEKIIRFIIPYILVKVSFLKDSELDKLEMKMDTVIINTDSLKLILVYHGYQRIHKIIDNISWVRVEAEGPGNVADN